MSEPIRIANCSGFYGDRLSAAEIPTVNAAQTGDGCSYRYEAARMGGGAS